MGFNNDWFARWTRLVRHRWVDERHSKRVVPPAMIERLRSRVAASERRHSGEVRICVEASLPLSYLWRHAWGGEAVQAVMRQRALAMFGKLQVWDTEHNNGVLIHLLLAERHIELVADRGLNAHVSPIQWRGIVERLGGSLKSDQVEDGLTEALAEVSALLVAHFPQASTQQRTNELSDEPVIG